ncbi:hypothetical protein MY1884_001728 [Beauveria asiatica]
MKFGLNYDKHIVPKWSQHYIDYNGLRMQLRAKTRRGESIQELSNELIAEIAHFKDFYINATAALGANGDATVELDGEGQPPANAVPGGPVAASPVSPSSQSMTGVYATDDCNELRKFGKLSIVAIRRLLGKFAATGQATSQDLVRAGSELEEWAEPRQTIDEGLNLGNRPSIGREVSLNGTAPSPNGRGAGEKAPSGSLRVDSTHRDDIDRFLAPQSLENFELLLESRSKRYSSSGMGSGQGQFFGRLLCLVANCRPSSFIDAILKHNPDISVRTSRGESALYCASQSGSLSVVQSVVEYFRKSGESLDSAVPRTGWTPLMVACAKGHADVAAHLLSFGADAQKLDVLGWTAREHSAYRGHLEIASLDGFASASMADGGLAGRASLTKETVHNTLTPDKKAVVVTLGSIQGGHDRKTLKLKHQVGGSDGACLESKSLEIIIGGADCASRFVQLPLWEDQSVKPLVGKLDLGAQVQVTVRLWDNGGTPASNRRLASSGTVLLSDDYARFGASRESMLRETTVIMLDKETMEFSGTVLISYVIATPFEGLDHHEAASYKRRFGDPVRLVGHRGLGQNTAGKSNLQIGENTVTFGMIFDLWCSLDANADIDVQITRDLEAVIYHDFSFSGSGSDVPIHDISLAQYKYAGDMQNPSGALLLESGTQRPRAFSSGEDSLLKAIQAQERLRCTVDFDGKGFKANIRGHSIQDAHATLEELLATLPEEIGFNIELKYQRLHEAVEAGVASVTIDINTFVDVALEKIKRLASRRPIILSSFTPEICILLNFKQNAYPVLFITNAGKLPMMDKELRAASLQIALKFARCWQLSGLVLACDTFLLCPRLISLVQDAGLVCASYGLGNNDPANAKIQADAGIDILIVDKVKLIADALGKLQFTEE